MEYTASLEEKANTQAKQIIDIESSMDSQTVLTKATYFAASALAMEGSNKELNNTRQ